MFESLLSTSYEPGTVAGAKVHRKKVTVAGPQGAQSLERKKPYLGHYKEKSS